MATDPTVQKSGESDVDYFRRMVGTANKRLERLEKYSQQSGYGAALNYAYSAAVYDIKALNPGAKNVRFSVVLKKTKTGDVNLTDLHAKINAVRGFLDMQTGTKTGIKEMYEKRTATINQKYGTNFKSNELSRVFQRLNYMKQNKKNYGSGTVLKAIGALKRAGSKKELDAALKANQALSDDAVVNEVARSLAEQGLSAKDFA